jgi:hypothetical protein
VKRLELVQRVLELGDRRRRQHVVVIVAIDHAMQGEGGLHHEPTDGAWQGLALGVASLGPEQPIGFDRGNEVG